MRLKQQSSVESKAGLAWSQLLTPQTRLPSQSLSLSQSPSPSTHWFNGEQQELPPLQVSATWIDSATTCLKFFSSFLCLTILDREKMFETWDGIIAAIILGIKSRIIPTAVVDATDKNAFTVRVSVAVTFSIKAWIGQWATGIPSIASFCNYWEFFFKNLWWTMFVTWEGIIAAVIGRIKGRIGPDVILDWTVWFRF